MTKDRGELYVITGPIYADGDGNIPDITKTNNACKTEIKFGAEATCDLRRSDQMRRRRGGAGWAFKIFYDRR